MVRWLAAALAGVLAVQAAQRHVPGVFIVQYQDDSDPSAVLDDIMRKHDLEVRQKLHYKLFKGAEVKFSNIQTAGSAAAAIGSMPTVKRVWRSRRYEKPQVSAGSVGNGHVGHETVKRAVEEKHDTFPPHVMTQVNLLRDAGYVGKGFKVAIVDTGIDYTHPALGGGFGPGHLVSFGTDLVGDDYNFTNTPVPDPDPIDMCNGHGTHVAGIIAAQPDKNPYGIIGAAAGVSLGSYKVFGCNNAGTGDGPLIAAFNQAFEDGADLIHASLGGESGWPEGLWAAAISTIVAHGVPCTVAVGNDGVYGIFNVNNGGDAVGGAAVGSINSVVAPALQVKATYSVNGGGPVSFGFTPGSPKNWTKQTLSLWTPVTNISDIEAVGCDPFPDTTPNLGGSLVLVPQGGCPNVVKAQNAMKWGAKHVMAWSDWPGSTTYDNVNNLSDTGIPIGMVAGDQGVKWAKLLLSGAKVDVNMVDVATAPVVLVTTNNTRSGGYMSTFTSWGPTWELAIKPQFSAPGREILSTWPLAFGGYLVSSGTSMAAPLVAAIYVLLMEATSIRDPAMLGRLLSASAKQLEYNDGLQTRVGVLAPVTQQGAGLTQVWDASRLRTVFDVDSLAFNDTAHFEAVRNFTITNMGNVTLQYRLDHAPAAAAYTFDNDSSLRPSQNEYYLTPQPNIVPNEVVNGSATLEFFFPTNSSESPKSFSIPPGNRRVVSVRVTPPVGLDDGRMPVWSGYIRLTGSDKSKLSLPYQGVTGSLRDRPILNLNKTGVRGSTKQKLLLGPHTFLLPPQGKSNLTRWAFNDDTDLVQPVAKLYLGSPLVRVDLIPVDVPGAKFNLTTILGTQTIGLLPDWPFPYQPAESIYNDWDGRLVDGTYAPEGVYKVSIKALRISGDPDKREDYDMVESLEFGIRYAYDI